MEIFGIKITVEFLFALVFGVYMIICGITYISKGSISEKSTEKYSQKYTSESIVNYSRCEGIISILLGVGLFLTFVLSGKDNPHSLIPDPTNKYIMLIIIGVVIVAAILCRIFVLKKKATATESKVVSDVVSDRVEEINEEDMQE